jgi:hypothetical protein
MGTNPILRRWTVERIGTLAEKIVSVGLLTRSDLLRLGSMVDGGYLRLVSMNEVSRR